MPSPEAIPQSGAAWLPLVTKELREVTLGNALWVALLIVVPLTGYGYVQAARLYGEASRSANRAPELARGLSPFDGIVVPTFGALYLSATLLLPFVAIRTIAAEKQDGSLKLLVQLPYSTFALIAAKLTAIVFAWTVLLCPSLAALGLWGAAGGHVNGREILNLILGHALYASVIVGVALAAAAVSQSMASAAIVTLGVTLGFWALDFAAAGDDGLLKTMATFSPTATLRTFERGIFSLQALIASFLAGGIGAAIAGIWLHPGRSMRTRGTSSLIAAFVLVGGMAIATQLRYFADATENRRNSFSVADESALRTMGGRLSITVHLAGSDPRLYDLERGVLGKLERTLPRVTVVRAGDGSALTNSRDDQYGEVVYGYDGQQAMSRSTSDEEILPLVLGLAGTKRPAMTEETSYPGYALIAETRAAEIGFYLLMPLAVISLWRFLRRTPAIR